MTAAVRLSAFVLLAALSFSPVFAAEPWNEEPFATDAKALLEAANAIPAGESGVVVLLEETKHTFDDKGGSITAHRRLYRISDESAIDSWGSVNASWAPWVQERPVIRARVVTKEGTIHELDANAVVEAPAPEESLDIFSDNRVIRAPLPAVAVGSVIEQLITYKSKESMYDAASSDVVYFGGFSPMHRVRLIVDAPASLEVKFVNRASIEPRREERDGRQHIVFEGGPFAPKEDFEWDLPYDVAPLPWVGVSTAKSWQVLATRYAEIVEKQLANQSLEKQTREAIGNAKDRREIVARVLAWIQKRVRYAGVEVGESSVVPRPPLTTLSNQYGDCKDKATLLVAMLRHAGIPAHVALLRAGEDFDVPRDLPGLGMFNHAIVVVEGDLWVDPTDEFARAGELPLMDQGRLALVASKETKEPVTTPLSESKANVLRETRTFVIPEEGKATVTEITEPTGADESSMRRYYVSSDRKKYRESMEEYAKNYYSAKSLSKLEVSDAHDLTKPFRLHLEASEAARGIAVDGEAAVAIFPHGLIENLPWSLRDTASEDADEEEIAKKKRKNDFFFSRPFVREWHYRIPPPAGFIARTLPENETIPLGTMTLTKQYAVAADGSVTATLRLDSGKRRLSPAEVEATKKAIKDLNDSNAIMIGFDQRGAIELAKGNIAGALAEFRKLAAMHPKEGRHQTEIARALLIGGMGEAAREQIKKAIALEPKYARAHRMLGVILQHDLFGRPFRKGCDIPGAVAAFKKARDLDPEDNSIRADYAKLLEFGDDALLFGRNSHADEAIAEYKVLIDEENEPEYEPELHLALARSKKFDELRERLKNASEPVQQKLWNTVAIAATQGAKHAITHAGSEDQSQRKEILRTASGILMALRMYGTAADLIEESMQGSPSAEVRQQVESLRRAKRIEELSLPKDDPKTVVRRLLIESILSGVPAELAKFYVSDERDILLDSEEQRTEWHSTRLSLLNIARTQGLPLEFYADVALGSLTTTQDGDDETGYRIRLRSAINNTREETVYVVKEGDEYRVSATNKSPALIGLSVLRLVDAGKLDGARQWLNWTREDFTAGSGDDPLASSPFSKYWPKNKQTATADELRIGAAMLMPSKELGERALRILTASREKASTDEERLRLDQAIAITHSIRKEYKQAAEAGSRLLAAHPDSAIAFHLVVGSLTELDRNKEVVDLANARLERIPKDPDALRGLAGAAMRSADYDGAEKFYRQIVDQLRPTSSDYNNVAWNALLRGTGFDKAIEDARQAIQLAGGGAADLHTLASLYAETGKSLEAREALLESMDNAGREEPADYDWYVLGRIAENYGATEAALAAYKRVEKPATTIASSTYVLAERRVKAIGKK
jgi:tetratricopeptide (TPR) repeat protein